MFMLNWFFFFLQIFAGAFPANYEPPTGFYFEVNADSDIVQVNYYGIEQYDMSVLFEL